MSDTPEGTSIKTDTAQSPSSGSESGTPEGEATASHRLHDVLESLKKHPLGALAAGAAMGILVEEEVALGILAGMGMSALLATRSGAEARREVATKVEEILERTRGRLKARSSKSDEAPPADAATEAKAPSAS